jgi:hypothetical protein
MDSHAQDFARQIISRLDEIKRLIHDAITFAREKRNSSKEENHKSDNRENPSGSPGANIVSNTTPSIGRDNPSTTTKQERFPRLKEWQPVAEMVGIAVLVVYTGVTIALWCSSKQANKIATDNFREVQRPYAIVQSFASNFPELGKPIFVDIHFKNDGMSPAVDGLIFRHVVFGKDAESTSLRKDNCADRTRFGGGNVWGQGEPYLAGAASTIDPFFVFTINLTAAPPPDKMKNWDGAEPIIVFGTVCYDDRFHSRTYYTEFAARYHRTETQPGQFRPQWINIPGRNHLY